MLAPMSAFAEVAESFRQSGASGANVTLPFKREAYEFARERTARAERGKSVNTLSFEHGTVVGDCTDGVGLCRDIVSNLGQSLQGASVLLIGAGGAARGVVGALLDCLPQSLVIANRTQATAEKLVHEFDAGNCFRAVALGELVSHRFDVLINATSASLAGTALPIPAACFDRNALAYDMVYGKGLTPFLAAAAAVGARTADGLGMLVEQAAEAFYVWRGVRPTTGPVIAMMKNTAS
jgi:shikimate dehydrogenase